MDSKQEILIEEKAPWHVNGIAAMIVFSLLILGGLAIFVVQYFKPEEQQSIPLAVVSVVLSFVLLPLLIKGLRLLRPNEAVVLTLFGKYYGSIKNAGFYYVNPFASSVYTAPLDSTTGKLAVGVRFSTDRSIISLKTMTLSNDKQKINDLLGNPIIIGVVVIWKVVNTAKAIFNVESYTEFLSIQCDSVLRNTVKSYPYDLNEEGSDVDKTLRGSSDEIADKLKDELQLKVEVAGLEIVEAQITHLAYAPEIAAAMLQRQQAAAVIDARQMIVDGAVGMVELALDKLSKNNVVQLDEERKAAMVSNLLVVLCANKEAQPIVNSGTLY